MQGRIRRGNEVTGMAETRITGPLEQIDHIGRSGIYPASGPLPHGTPAVRGQAELGHPEQRVRQASGASAAVPQLLGRALFAGFFLYNGINHFANRAALTEYARSKGVPAPGAAVAATGLLLLAGGLSLLTGRRPKAGASLITTFLLGVSPQMHAFWKETDPEKRMHEMVNFTKNMALVGGAMFAAALPEPWPYRAALRERGGLPVRVY
jgi:putative oxidoreductase